MASVYLALDVRLDRTVAVKVMHRSLAEDPAFVRRFIGEAKSVASLSHPNIVHVFDQGTDGDVVYLSMEYVPGRTLRDVLRERGRLSAREALEIMIPVLAALGAAHQAGMAHRDVKPENVLLTDDGRVKVVDFGLARAIEATNQTRTGVMIGTIGYMAPEQVTTGGADVRSDVYASGIMLFELVTGRQPYDGQTPMAVAYKHVHETVPPPSSLVPETSPLIDTLVATATAHDPAARYQDASAMLVAAVDAHRLLPRLSTPPTGSGAHLLTPPPMASGPHAVPPGPVPPATVPPAPQRTLIQPRADVLTAPPARRSWRPHWFLVGLAALMVVAIGLTAWFVSRPTMITLPDLTSLNLVSAQQKAASLGLDVKVLDGRHDDKVPEGRVLSMNPPAGTEVEEKSTVQLVPSLGPKLVMVPGVRDMTEEQARVLITQAGLKVGKVRRMENPDVQRGLVMETRPPAGERVKEGTAVELRISAGLTMPDVGGMSRDEAKAHLESLGLQVQVHEVNDDNEPCTVIAQVPKAKTEIDKGQAVQITVVNCGFSFVWPWGDHEARDDSQVVVVPSVLGKQVGDAKRELEQLGFKVRVRRAAGTGVVAYQHPRDTERPAGWTVTIWH